MRSRGVLGSAVTIVVALLLSGCDDRPCLKWHEETFVWYIQVANVMIPQKGTTTVCDEYGESPSGKN